MKFRLTMAILMLWFYLTAQVNRQVSICDQIVEIDSSEYKKRKINYSSFPVTTSFKKVNGVISIPTKDSSIIIREVYDENDLGYTYNVAGEDKTKGWILIERVDLHENIYLLVTPKSNKIDTLIGVPQIYGDKILCLESMYTDDPWRVEIWQIDGSTIKMIKKFSLAACDIHAVKSIFLSNKTLFISNSEPKYWRAKVLE